MPGGVGVIRFVADGNFDRTIVQGVRQSDPLVDVIIAQKSPGAGTPDPDLLAWAAVEERVVLSHDQRTLPAFAFARVDRREPMPGVILVRQGVPRPAVIGDILIAVLLQHRRRLGQPGPISAAAIALTPRTARRTTCGPASPAAAG